MSEKVYKEVIEFNQHLLNADFYSTYKIGVKEDRYGDVDKVLVDEEYHNNINIKNLNYFYIEASDNPKEIFGDYDKDSGSHTCYTFCVLTKKGNDFVMSINFERASGPCSEGRRYYEFGDGNEPVEAFAYGRIYDQAYLFSIPVGSNYQEEIKKVLEKNNFWFNEEFLDERKNIRTKKEEDKRIEEEEKVKAKKMADYLKLKTELGL